MKTFLKLITKLWNYTLYSRIDLGHLYTRWRASGFSVPEAILHFSMSDRHFPEGGAPLAGFNIRNVTIRK